MKSLSPQLLIYIMFLKEKLVPKSISKELHFSPLEQADSFLVCVQESPTHPKTNQITGFCPRHNLWYDKRGLNRPRLAIYSSRNLNLWLNSKLTNSDITTCTWKTNDPVFPEILIVSVYMNITDALTWLPTLNKAIQAPKKRKSPILFFADTNSHSSLWGSDVSNTRGEHIIVPQALFVCFLVSLCMPCFRETDRCALSSCSQAATFKIKRRASYSSPSFTGPA